MQATPANKNRCIGAYGSTCGEPIPQYKGVTRIGWTTGSLGLSLRHRYVDSVTTDRIALPQNAGLPTPNTHDDHQSEPAADALLRPLGDV